MGKQHEPNQSGGGQAKSYGGKLHQPPNFLGKSGQGDNQSTNRGKGKS